MTIIEGNHNSINKLSIFELIFPNGCCFHETSWYPEQLCNHFVQWTEMVKQTPPLVLFMFNLIHDVESSI